MSARPLTAAKIAASSAIRLFEPSGAELVVPARARTLDGFRAWALSDDFASNARIGFLDGELWIDMSPEELQTHVKVKMELGRVLGNLNRQLDLGDFYGDGSLLSNASANLSTEPDGTFVRWESLESGRVKLIERKGAEGQHLEIEGSPDWVLEVVSKSSVHKDNELLRDLYFRAGVDEYWLVDARGDEVRFAILQRDNDGFVETPSVKGWLASQVFGRRFRLSRRKGRMDLWQYTLHQKK
jgi:Uma2 family endonuclease